jgi:Flp pilus assembly protein CpaB
VNSSRRRLIAAVAGIAAAALFTYVIVEGRGTGFGGSATGSSGGVATVPVVVATTDLVAGTKLTADNIGLRPYPESEVISGATLTNPAIAIGQYISVSMPSGTMILQTFLLAEAPTAGNTVASAPLPIDPGYEAVSIPFDTSKDVGGYIQPEDHLDILVQTSNGQLQYGFQDVRVLRVGYASGAATPAAAPEVMVVELRPQKAATLSYLYQNDPNAVIRFVLRSRLANNSGTLPNSQPIGAGNWSQYLDG